MIFIHRSRRGCAAVIAAISVSLVLIGCSSEAESPDVTQPVSSTPATPSIGEQAIITALESAQAYVSRGDLPSAQTILEELAAKAQDDVRPVEQLGQVLYRRSQQVENPEIAAEFRRRAADAYRRAVEIDPDSAGLRHSAGLILLGAGDQQAALSMFKTAGELDPSNPQHPLYAAQLLIQQKRYDDAEADLRRALKLDSSLAHAHASLAVIAAARDDFEQAMHEIDRARVLDPANVDFRAQQARIFRQSGKPRDSLQRLVALPQHVRAEPIIAGEIAAAYMAMDSPANAARAWQVSYSHHIEQPESWYAAAKAADALIDAGEREQAQIWLRRATAVAPHEQLVRDVQAKLSAAGDQNTQDDSES